MKKLMTAMLGLSLLTGLATAKAGNPRAGERSDF